MNTRSYLKYLLINYKDLILLSINSILIVLLLIVISTILYYTNIISIATYFSIFIS